MAVTEAEVIPPETSTGNRYLAKHSPEIRAEALKRVEDGQTPSKVARALKIPVGTIYYWLEADQKPESIDAPILLASKFERAAHLFISLALKRAKKASFAHLMTGAGIAVDKMQLLRGQPTSIHEERTIDSRQVLVLLQETIGPSDPTPQPALNPANTES
jgi:hypothetical protein